MPSLPPLPPPFIGEIRPDLLRIVAEIPGAERPGRIGYWLPGLPDGYAFFTDGRELALWADLPCFPRGRDGGGGEDWSPLAVLDDRLASDGVLDRTAFGLDPRSAGLAVDLARHALSLLRGVPPSCAGFALDDAGPALSAIVAAWFDAAGIRGLDHITVQRVSKPGVGGERIDTLRAGAPAPYGMPAAGRDRITRLLQMVSYIGGVIGFDPGIAASRTPGAYFPTLAARASAIHRPASAHAAMHATRCAEALRTAHPEIDRYIAKALARLRRVPA